MIAKVVLNNREQNIDKVLDYSVPQQFEAAMQPGIRVAVPIGYRDRIVEGMVIGTAEESEYENLKELYKILGDKPVCAPWIIKLCLWVSRKYFCSFYQALRLAMPPGISRGASEKVAQYAFLNISRNEAFDEVERLKAKNAAAQARILEKLIMVESMPVARLVKEKIGDRTSVKALANKGFVRIETERIERQAYIAEKYEKTVAYTPTEEQKTVIDYLYECIDDERHEKILLRGVTGSGKTEVFLQAIERVIEKGKNAIMLVPEISLTPQMVQRFVGRFGNRVAVIHSALSEGERLDQWNKIKRGEVCVVVGARSAIFAPFDNIGIIILDEEHETSYKSETSPRYHAIDIAAKRAETESSVLLLASATPSVCEYYGAKSGKYRLFEMTKRYNDGAMPRVDIVDMRGELFNLHNHSPISIKLQSEIRKNLESGQKTILFLNRRGYSTFVSCRQCGEVIKCPECDIALTYHKRVDSLSCHYCGYTQRNVTVCPFCGSKYIKYFGTGTQRIEEELKNLFPTARVLRMDTDTTSQKGGHERILDKFANGEADILLGTQMVTKGLDFHDVTLVGVLAADTALAVDDFRANERSFSLFTQVCGRAGRGELAGRAVIQTYQPGNTTIQFAKQQDYPAFYENEIIQRKRLNYPPFCDIICIMVTGEDEDRVARRTEDVAEKLKEDARSISDIIAVIGPVPAPIAKIRNNYRYRIIMKCFDTSVVNESLREVYEVWERIHSGEHLSIDINPNNMY